MRTNYLWVTALSVAIIVVCVVIVVAG